MLKSSIRGIMGPPPTLEQPATASPLTLNTFVTQALQQSPFLSIASSAYAAASTTTTISSSSSSSSSSSTITRMKHLCIHPSVPHVIDELDPQSPHQSEPNKPSSPHDN